MKKEIKMDCDNPGKTKVYIREVKQFKIKKAFMLGRIRSCCEYNEKQQLIERFYKNEWWAELSIEDFQRMFKLTPATIKKHLSYLIKNDFIIVDSQKNNWYRVNNLEIEKYFVSL